MYLNNAQSVLTEITMRDTDLVNVQVLVGMAMVFWTAENFVPALMLIGTALRLAHKLGLHTRRSSKYHSPTSALQRSRVFWMAYILDKDISLQTMLPPVQLDSDIDLDLPPFEAEKDLLGFIFAADGHTKMNYFRARVELARIQVNRVFEAPHSAAESDQELTKKAMKNLENMVQETGSEKLRNLRDALQRLCSYADSISSQHSAPEQDSPKLNLWDGEVQAGFLVAPGYQDIENEVFMPELDFN
ncbi:hypothetical protein SLS62_007679 [Diatrype stigma]|uniref:Xylanolytic transcriptional activator regulatory domain-containing protein n=1 Tax=Diatrype stigma TaxID=117547 RepID=A0AAN9YQI4_9PEZI